MLAYALPKPLTMTTTINISEVQKKTATQFANNRSGKSPN